MSLVNEFIQLIEDNIDSDSEMIKFIKNPSGLISALKELDNIIGAEKVKKSIVQQIKFLLVKHGLLNNKNSNLEDHVLNTVLYGPPGVGKTTIGVILAKIWNNLGILNYKRNTLRISKTFLYAQILLSNLNNMDNRMARKDNELLTDISKKILSSTHPKINKSTNDDIIKIVSRSDFVAGYTGQTALKTKNLLEENEGKVLFIDEAYSLCEDDKDTFGMEALTTLNKYMSENPDKMIVIFAGYEDKIKQGIFKIQPGLERRCSWVFRMNGYNSIELGNIFSLQLKQKNWGISSDVDLVSFFQHHKKEFTYYGGDTQKLAFYSKLTSYEQHFNKTISGKNIRSKRNRIEDHKEYPNKRVKINIISKQSMKEGMKMFKNNKINSKKCSEIPFGMYH